MALVTASMSKRLRNNFKAFGLIILSVMSGMVVSEYVHDHFEDQNGPPMATESASKPNTQMWLGQVTTRH